jgi:hypothetical protein
MLGKLSFIIHFIPNLTIYTYFPIIFFLKIKCTPNPKIAPNQSVPNLIIMAAPTESTDVSPKYCNIPEIVASAIPRPPGIMLIAPIKDAKLNTNVDKSTLRDCPNPIITK